MYLALLSLPSLLLILLLLSLLLLLLFLLLILSASVFITLIYTLVHIKQILII